MDGHDYFKIVAVMKKKRIEYCYVPHKWEENNCLFWPQANLRLLRSDAGSKPAPDWNKYKCKVKKSLISGLEEAELWEEQFVEAGTDAEEMPLAQILSKPPITKQFENENSLDAEFENLNQNKVVLYTEPSEPTSCLENPPQSNEETLFSYVTMDRNVLFSEENSNYMQQENSQFLIQKLTEIQQNQEKILDNQERLTQILQSEFTHQKATYDKVYKMLKEMQLQNHLSPIEKENIELDVLNKFEFPLATIDDVFAFNKELEINKEYRSSLIKTYTAIGGKEGNEDGKIIAKKLKKIFFTEHVLTLFSWTGVSRTPGMPKKETFQLCENIISLFMDLLLLADNRWNLSKNEKFFKYNTLKHAKQSEKAYEKRKGGEKKKTVDVAEDTGKKTIDVAEDIEVVDEDNVDEDNDL